MSRENANPKGGVSSENPGAVIAANMKIMRKTLGLSQEQLSERSGIPRSTIASLERGEGNPTLQVLMGISSGLSVGISELLMPPLPKAEIYNKDSFCELPKNLVTLSEALKRESVDIVRMTPEISRYLILEKVELYPGEKFFGNPHPPGTEEYFFSVSGKFGVEVGQECFKVEPEQLLCFDGNQKHSYGAIENTTPETICIGYSVIVQIPRS